MTRLSLRLLAIPFALTACSDDPTGPQCALVSLPVSVELTDTVSTGSGLRYLTIAGGTGDASEAGDVAGVRYAGMLEGGDIFDAGAFRFQLGTGGVIDGFDEGVSGMRLCEARRIIVPPELGYGDDPPSTSQIPDGATLIFDVQLVDLQ